MKSDAIHIQFSFQKLFTLALIVSMLTFPIISMFSSIHALNKNVMELHDEKDTGEKESIEENCKNEKKDFQTTHLDFINMADWKAVKNYGVQNLTHNFIHEISIPPPDLDQLLF